MLADPVRTQQGASQGSSTATRETDALAAPFESRCEVDLLLNDLAELAPRSATPAERAAHRASLLATRSGGGRAVLVVESSPIARKFLALRLRSLGYEVHLAERAEQALEMVQSHAFTIVFLELVLASNGDLDGLGVCQAIKQKPKQAGRVVPAVVMTTGQTGSSHRVRSSLAGCDAYLNKPLIEGDFVAALAEVDPLFR